MVYKHTCMKFINRYTAWILTILVIGSCNDPYNDQLDTSKLNLTPNEIPEETALDTWLFENFTAPYNIEVKYRWDGSELDANKTLVPPLPDKVESIMDVVKSAWIDPYTNEAGETFLKTYCPKQFVLVGSAEYNPGGTITLGTAEGGRKIVLYVVNEFDNSDRRKVKEQLHTVHHEFAHILHQNILYPAAFKLITAGGYTADWYNTPLNRAQSKGFITSYAMSAPDEDFVEMIAVMLIEGKRGFDRIVCAIKNESAQASIRQKEQYVVNYFSDVYDVDIYELQTLTDAAIDSYAPKTLLADLGLGQSQMFSTINIIPDDLPAFPPDFQGIYDDTADGVQSITEGDGALDSVQLLFTGYGNMYLRFFFSVNAQPPAYEAQILYSITSPSDNVVRFNFLSENGDAAAIKSAIQPLVSYFEDNTFSFDWIEFEEGGCIKDLAGFFPQELPASYDGFGRLTN